MGVNIIGKISATSVIFSSTSGGVTFESFTTPNVQQSFVDIPAHNANDMIVLFIRSNVNQSIPSIPTSQIGWNTLASEATTFGYGWRVVNITDTANNISTITCSGNVMLAATVIRGAVVGDVQVNTENIGTSAVLPTLSLSGSTSRVLACVSLNQATTLSVPADMTFLGENPTGGANWSIWLSTSTETSFTGRTSTFGTAAAYSSWAVELMPA